ncbi:MAG: hypothetical protein HYX48_05945 [Chlamydiales bacterium]|nr:hypothetical protein [Chlamydiales bacterium]
MRSLLNAFVLQNWQRKLISVVLAIVIWFSVHLSLTSTKTLSNIPVRIANVPSNKTVEGLQHNGLLSRRITLSLVGNKKLLDDLSSHDLEVVVDAADKPEEWIASLTKKNLVSLNPEIDLSSGISRISHQSFIIRLTKLVSEKIPVLITRPVGEAPRDYQFLDVWPYQLHMTVSGPEEMVKHLKAKGVKLTFNLHEISKSHLDELASEQNQNNKDVVSFYVPDLWKQIQLPLLSDQPLEINDPQAEGLRIDFVRSNLLPIEKPIPISLYVPPKYAAMIDAKTLTLSPSPILEKIGSLYFLKTQLCAKGVSLPFLKVVREMMELMVIVVPSSEKSTLEVSLQFINPRAMEERYVSMMLSDTSDSEVQGIQPGLREEYLRNRFRNYMNRLQLAWPDDTRVNLKAELEGTTVSIKETAHL